METYEAPVQMSSEFYSLQMLLSLHMARVSSYTTEGKLREIGALQRAIDHEENQ